MYIYEFSAQPYVAGGEIVEKATQPNVLSLLLGNGVYKLGNQRHGIGETCVHLAIYPQVLFSEHGSKLAQLGVSECSTELWLECSEVESCQ